MFKRPWNLRGSELQLLVTVLLFFAAGYLLVAITNSKVSFVPSARSVADVLWPSVLPFLLFLGVSLGMSWRSPRADQLMLPLVALLAGLGLLMMARLTPDLPDDFIGIDA